MSEMMPKLTELPHGVRIPVRVAPRASRAKVLGVHAGALKVALTAPPVDGAANAALIQLLSKRLGVPKGAIAIVSGQHSRDKLIEVTGLVAADVAERIGLVELDHSKERLACHDEPGDERGADDQERVRR